MKMLNLCNVIRPKNLQCFAVSKINFNQILMLFIELRAQVLTINTLEKANKIYYNKNG